LVRFFGLEGASLWAAAGNLTAALAALLPGGRPSGAEAAPAPVERPSETDGAHRPSASLGLWAALYALSGFCALSLEIVWFRVIDVATKSTAFTFGTVLSIYLLGLGAGSLAGAWNAHRIRRPLAFFVSLQCALLTWSAAALALLTRLPPATPIYGWFFDYWRSDIFFQLGSDWDPGGVLRLYLLLPAFLYGIPTVLMGLSFTALQRAVQDDPVTSGRRVGLLQAANIAGCVAGSFVTGLVLLGRLGTTGSLRVLLAAGGVFLLVRARREGPGAAVFGGAAALALAAAALPSNERVWLKLHGVADPAGLAFIGEDATAVSAVTPAQAGHWRVAVNGLPHSWVPFEGIHTLLGAVPAVVHPAPVEVAVVGLGSGETAWAASCRPETRSITVFEIAASQVDLLRRLTDAVSFPELRRLLDDERVRFVAADGRHALKRSGRAYDLIQIDALFRTSAGSGNMYSVEFFRLCASRLKPGGILCTQAPTRRVALTFQAALPHSIDFGNIVVGSNEPLPFEVEAWTTRLRSAPVEAWLGRDVADGILARLQSARAPWGNPNSRRGLNHDLFPRDEFATPVAR
jgi:spermidine synthase